MPLDVDPVDATGSWVRINKAGRAPHGRPARPVDNRWQHGRVVDALYLTQDEDGMWAEWYRYLAEFAVEPLRAMPVDVLEVDVPALPVADLSDVDRLGRVGLSTPTEMRT